MENVEIAYFQTTGIDTYTNPLLHDGALIHALNVVSSPYGGKSKRLGYSQFLGNPDSSKVQSLFSLPNIGNDSTKLNLYRASGSIVYYSLQGTGAWTVSGNGTITNGNHFGAAILDNTLIGGDGVTNTRHTTNGTSFTDTTLAPKSEFFEEYQRRIYAAGTSQTLFYSTTNDATNWNTSGTSDSNSLEVPGEGKMGNIFSCADKLNTTKSSGLMHKWDGYSLIDASTKYGPSSPYSIARIEGYRLFANANGIYGFSGGVPQLLSNSIQRQFYNSDNTGIVGTAFSSFPAISHRYDYLLSAGTLTDDFTGRTIPNAIIKYDYQKNEFLNWQFANFPTSYHSYRDTSGSQQLIFGDSSGQCYQLDSSTTDNGSAIPCEMVFLISGASRGLAHIEKQWRWWRGFFNPGCEAKVQVACSDFLEYSRLSWQDVGDCSNGFVEYRFPDKQNRSRFLFVRIYESSKNSKMVFYGQQVSCIPNPVW